MRLLRVSESAPAALSCGSAKTTYNSVGFRRRESKCYGRETCGKLQCPGREAEGPVFPQFDGWAQRETVSSAALRSAAHASKALA